MGRLLRSMSCAYSLRYLLGQVVEKYALCILLEVLLEGVCEVYHGLPCTQLRTLHHALLVVHEQIGTARQYIAE